jgi:hypothetical protein
MKLLRWEYVYSLLALALVCTAAAPNQARAAIYTASMTSTWTITGFIEPMGGSDPIVGITRPDGLIISASADASGSEDFSGGVAPDDGDASYSAIADILAVSPGDLQNGDSISIDLMAEGSALIPGTEATSDASAMTLISFTNGSAAQMEFAVTFEIDYAYALTTGISSADEDAEASVTFSLFEDPQTPWLAFETIVRGGAGQSDSDQLPLYVNLLPDETRTVYLNTSVSGFAKYAPADNGGGGGSGNNDPNAVPEPSTIAIWSLFGVVGLAVGAVRRRRNT